MKISLDLTAIRFDSEGDRFPWEESADIEGNTRGEIERAASVLLSDFQGRMDGDRVIGRLEISEQRNGIKRRTSWEVTLSAVALVPPPGPLLSEQQKQQKQRRKAREQTRSGLQPSYCPGCGHSLNFQRRPFCVPCFQTIPEYHRTGITNAYAGGLGRNGRPYRAAVIRGLDALENAERGGEGVRLHAAS